MHSTSALLTLAFPSFSWQGLTPAHYAAMEGHLPVLEWLAANGADVNATDNDVRLAAMRRDGCMPMDV